MARVRLGAGLQHPGQHDTHHRHQGGPFVVDGVVDRLHIKAGVEEDGDPVDHRPEEDGEAPHVEEGQHGQPPIAGHEPQVEGRGQRVPAVVAIGEPGPLGPPRGPGGVDDGVDLARLPFKVQGDLPGPDRLQLFRRHGPQPRHLPGDGLSGGGRRLVVEQELGAPVGHLPGQLRHGQPGVQGDQLHPQAAHPVDHLDHQGPAPQEDGQAVPGLQAQGGQPQGQLGHRLIQLGEGPGTALEAEGLPLRGVPGPPVEPVGGGPSRCHAHPSLLGRVRP